MVARRNAVAGNAAGSLDGAAFRRHTGIDLEAIHAGFCPAHRSDDGGNPRLPPQATWWPAVARLSQVSHWQDGKLEIRLQPLADIVRHQDEWLASRTASQRKTPHSKTIRRHVRAQINSMISNEMSAVAYRQHQSYRKAGQELSRQTGQKISKDKVARAVAAFQKCD